MAWARFRVATPAVVKSQSTGALLDTASYIAVLRAELEARGAGATGAGVQYAVFLASDDANAVDLFHAEFGARLVVRQPDLSRAPPPVPPSPPPPRIVLVVPGYAASCAPPPRIVLVVPGVE